MQRTQWIVSVTRKPQVMPLAVVGFTIAALMGLASEVRAEPEPKVAEYSVKRGQARFRTYCSSCHGIQGKGDGPVAEYFKVKPSDVTRIEPIEGEFPKEWLYRVIDGREWVRGHGEPVMPVWGEVFQSPVIQPGGHVVEQGPQLAARRIWEVVTYLESIQVQDESSE